MSAGEIRKEWHKYSPLASLNYNTTCHTSIRCELSRLFRERVPHNIPDHRLGLKTRTGPVPTTDFAGEMLRRTQILYDKIKKILMQLYISYKKYHNKKAKISPMQEKDYCYILKP